MIVLVLPFRSICSTTADREPLKARFCFMQKEKQHYNCNPVFCPCSTYPRQMLFLMPPRIGPHRHKNFLLPGW